ncbi:hypothetical protein NL676_006878 [Syzygium grande]|nr:hypothetical protein NL676_006878 [Syzygium grande]
MAAVSSTILFLAFSRQKPPFPNQEPQPLSKFCDLAYVQVLGFVFLRVLWAGSVSSLRLMEKEGKERRRRASIAFARLKLFRWFWSRNQKLASELGNVKEIKGEEEKEEDGKITWTVSEVCDCLSVRPLWWLFPGYTHGPICCSSRICFLTYSMHGSRSCFGCCLKPKLTTAVECAIKRGSISSISTSNQTIDPQTGNPGTPSEFINHGLMLWNQTRQRWRGNKRSENQTQQVQPKLNWNVAYDNLLGSDKAFPQPIPLSEMVDFLVDTWEQEGLYD